MFKRFFKASPSFSVSFETLGDEIEVTRHQTILAAGIENGLALPHGCRVGSCGACRCRLVEGKVKSLTDPTYILTAEELQDGYILACQAQPRSSIKVVHDNYDPEASACSTSLVKGRIITTRYLTHDILKIGVRLDGRIQYQAGQYAEIFVPSINIKRNYSFSEAPERGGNQEVCFHVRHVPGGAFTDWLHSADRVGEEVRVSAPYGAFWLRSSERPILCIAGGSGMAPIKSLLECAVRGGCSRPVTYLFGARTQSDLYCLDEIHELRRRWKAPFSFIPVLSAEPLASDWSGERGYVTEILERQSSELLGHEAYLCGPPGMIDLAISILRRMNVEANAIHYDKFIDASTAQAAE